ncbi:MAG: helical backbone metal receptor [Wenzhouxiangellaceae bacterium]|nr:helical backbone metal receptor [Wenzhouxiangellaceae bacterium]
MSLRPAVATLCALLLAVCATARAGPGDAVTVPPRVVALAPHLAELAFTAGGGDRLVGTVEWSDWPAAAQRLPRIGDAFRLDVERIVELQATDALAWGGGTPPAAVEQLRALGIDVHVIETRTLAQIAEALLHLGELLGSEAEAARAAEAFEQRLAAFERNEPEPRTIFYQVSRRPLFTLGGRHVINEVLALCGARNPFADLDVEAAVVDPEAVLRVDPWAIVAGDVVGVDGELADWREVTELRAVACGRLDLVDPALLVRPTPRILDGAEALCGWMDRVSRDAGPACGTGPG